METVSILVNALVTAAAESPWIALPLTLMMCYFGYALHQSRRFLSPKGKSVLITGCDTGFGHELAIHLHKKGVKVFAGCLTANGAEVLASKATGICAILLDVTKSDQIAEALETVERNLGDSVFWGLVNNAGIAIPGPLQWQTMADYRRVMDVNLFGAMEMTNTFFPMLRRSQGRIVNVASVAGRFPMPMTGVYSPSKYAMEGYSDVLRLEAGFSGVGVSIIEPGIFRTPIYDTAASKAQLTRLFGNLSDEKKQGFEPNSIDKILKAQGEIVKSPSTLNFQPVVDDMTHALLSLRPSRRYHPGSTKLLIPILHMPAWMQDFLIRQVTPRIFIKPQ